MDVCGEGDAIERSHMLRLASEGGVPEKQAQLIIDQMLDLASGFAGRAKALPIRQATARQMTQAVLLNQARLSA